MRELMVDDFEINSALLAQFVTLCGHEPIVAKDGFKVLELAAQCSPDLVLMDVMMPGMDG